MNRPEPAPSPPLAPAKLAMIVVLAIVLVVVLVIQFSGDQVATVAIKKRTARNSSTTAETSQPATSSSPAVRLHWPEIQREEIAAFNPFEVPEELKKPALIPGSAQSTQSDQIVQSSQSASTLTTGLGTEQQILKADEEQARIRAKQRESRLQRIKATASDLQKQGVGLVMSTSAGAVARIGEQEVRVGDVINGVLRIVEIGPRGIVVEEEPADE